MDNGLFQIVEVKEVLSDETVNDYLNKGWKLLNIGVVTVVNTLHGDISMKSYTIGRIE